MNQEYMEFLNCCLNNNEIDHLVEDPIMLSCGHGMCKRCIPANTDETVKCRICNIERTFNYDQSNKLVNLVMQENIKELNKIVSEKFHENVSKYESVLKKEHRRFSTKSQDIVKEIEATILSLMKQLDQVKTNLHDNLDEIKVKQNESEEYVQKDIDAFKNELEQLDHNIKNNQSLTMTKLYMYQEKLRAIPKQIDTLNQRLIHQKNNLKFKAGTVQLDDNTVGEIVYKEFIDIKSKLKKNDFINRKFEHCIFDICLLSNGCILVSAFKPKKLYLYDEEFNLIKEIDTIRNTRIHPVGLATNFDNEIYISDPYNHRVLKTDLEFRSVKLFRYYGFLKNPVGICYYKKKVYVCDWKSKKIHILRSDKFSLSRTHKFTYPVRYIKILNDIACVTDRNQAALYFYNLPDFSLRQKYEGHSGIISVINNRFYEYDTINDQFYEYLSNASQEDKFDFYNEIFSSNPGVGVFINHKSKLLFGSPSFERIYAF